MSKVIHDNENKDLLSDIRLLIEQSKRHIATQANSTLTMLFWQIGKRINDDILQNKRADYGKQVVPTLSAALEKLYGRSFTERNLRRMVQFSEVFPDLNIVTPLATHLSWSHFIILFPLECCSLQRNTLIPQLSLHCHDNWDKRSIGIKTY